MKKTLREIINHLKSAEYTRIEKALKLLEENPLETYYRALLQHIFINEEGQLFTPPAFAKNNTHQPPVDYAFWQLLGMAPWKVLEELGLPPQKIKKIKFTGYESYINHWHYIERFPHKITSLPFVEELDVTKSRIQALPVSIGNWKKLKVLNASKCKLKKIPNVFQHFMELESLNVSSNEINQVPQSFKALTRLKNLDLSNNRISKLTFPLIALTQLEKINLSSNKFAELPEVLTNNRSIKILDFENNPIQEIPATIVKMQAIEILNFNNCTELHTIPYQLQELPKLIKMNFGRCSHLTPAPHVKFFKQPSDFEIYFNKLKRKAGLLERKKPVPKKQSETPVKTDVIAPVTYHYVVKNEAVVTPRQIVPKQFTELDNQEVYLLSLLKDDKKESRELGYTVLEMSYNTALLKRIFNQLYESGKLYGDRRIQMNERLLAILLSYEEQGWLNKSFNCNVLSSLELNSKKTDIVAKLHKFPNLRELNLDLNKNPIQQHLPILHQVKKLSLQGFNNENWNWATHFPNLKKLDLEKMNSSTHQLIESHPALEDALLSTGGASLVKVSDCKQLVNLQVKFYYNHSKLDDFTIRVENCPKLTHLEINTSFCKRLMVRNCPNLKELSVLNEESMVYDLDVDSLKQVETITINHCCLTVCPDFVMECKQLKSLNLSFNDLKHLPDFLPKLKKLQFIHANSNRIKWFPEQVFSLTLLKELNLYSNLDLKVRWQYPTVYKDGFKRLQLFKKLGLSWNQAQKRKVRFMNLPFFM